MHHYGVDLRDLFSEERPLSPRFVLTLIMGLPIDSAFNAERRGGRQYRGWDEGRYALVAAVNALRALQHMYLAAHLDRKKHKLPDPPEPFPTPGQTQRSSKTLRPGSFAAVAAAQISAARAKKRKAQAKWQGQAASK